MAAAADAGGSRGQEVRGSAAGFAGASGGAGGGAVDDVEDFRSRWLYFGIYGWLQCSGRFMSLYYEAAGLTDAQVGAVFAAGAAASPLATAALGLLADRLAERRGPWARLMVFYGCVLWSTLCFTLQTLSWFGASRFSVMLVCRVLMDLARPASISLLDAVAVEGLTDRARYGEERLYGAYSWALMGIVMGGLLEVFGPNVMHVCKPIGAAVLGIVLWLSGSPPHRPRRRADGADGAGGGGLPPSGDASTAASAATGEGCGDAGAVVDAGFCELMGHYMSSVAKISFFVYAITLGVGMTLVENLLFIYFDELHASYLVDGLSVVVTVLFEIPLFARSKLLLGTFGARGCLVMTGLCYSFRVLGYTLVPGGAWVLLFEPMHGVTYAFWQTASVEVMASITPPAFAATGQTFLTSIRNMLGVMPGNLLGGLIIDRFGEAALYRGAALLVGCGLALYLVATHREPVALGVETPRSDCAPEGGAGGAAERRPGEGPRRWWRRGADAGGASARDALVESVAGAAGA